MTTNEIVQLKSYDENTGNEIGNVLPITNSEAVKVENDKNLKEKLVEINEQIEQTNALLDIIPNKIELRKIYNVEDYTIFPNGEDIVTKLQALVDKVYSDGGGVIQFNDGDYIIDSKLNSSNNAINMVIMKSNVWFRGSGSTVLKCNESKFYSLFRNQGYTHELNNVKFENITFNTFINYKPNHEINDYRCAILFDRATNLTIENCKFIFNGVQCIDFKTGNSIQAIIDAKNSGNYFCQNINIKNNEFIFRIESHLEYYDNNCIAMCGKNVWIEKNHFKSEILTDNFNKYPNCCIEAQGENVYIRDNSMEKYSNACDFNAVDTQTIYRNLVFENNRVKTYRGLMLWTTQKTMRGCKIKKNHFDLSIIDSQHILSGERACVGLTTHNRDSYDGIFKEIDIIENIFDLTSSKDYLLSLSEDEYKLSDSYVIMEIPFEAFYSTVLICSGSNERTNINIKDNTFINSVFPCVYVGGKVRTKDVIIDRNKFIDCSYNKKYYIISLNDYCMGIAITNNDIIDNGSTTLNGGLFILANGGQYYNDSNCRFFNCTIKNNNLRKTNITNTMLYTSNITKLWLSSNTIDYAVIDTGSAPTFTPMDKGLFIMDSVNKKVYMSIGTANASDWICLNS